MAQSLLFTERVRVNRLQAPQKLRAAHVARGVGRKAHVAPAVVGTRITEVRTQLG